MIHIFTGEYPPSPGGVGDYTALIASELTAAGDRVHVWAPGRAGTTNERGVAVHRVAGRFSPLDLLRLGRALSAVPAPRRFLVQWTPHSFGFRSLNVGFPLWIWARARLRGDAVELMVHEPFLAFGEGNWRQNAAAAVHRFMIAALLDAASRVWISIPAWARELRPWRLRRLRSFEWLPVPSNVSAPSSSRPAIAPPATAQPVVGHFGAFRPDVAQCLQPAIHRLLAQTNAVVLLAGSGSHEFRLRLVHAHPEAAPRLLSTGALSAPAVAEQLCACDVLLQPYPDGISSRRGSSMAALSLGIPIVTNLGPLSERFWRASGAVQLARSAAPGDLAAAVLELLRDRDLRRATGRSAHALYEDLFAVRHTIAALRRRAIDPPVASSGAAA